MGVPLRYRYGSGYPLQVLIRYAHCGLSAAIPHADMRAYIYAHEGGGFAPALVKARLFNKKKFFLPHFHWGGGGGENPIPPKKTLLSR